MKNLVMTIGFVTFVGIMLMIGFMRINNSDQTVSIPVPEETVQEETVLEETVLEETVLEEDDDLSWSQKMARDFEEKKRQNGGHLRDEPFTDEELGNYVEVTGESF